MLAVVLAAASSPSSESASVPLVRMSAELTIDGVLGPEEWTSASRLELGYQIQPGDNVPPTERTEIWLGHDGGRLCLAVRAHDQDAAAIRARVARRDDLAGDDTITLYLDTHDDRRRAYVFSFNALGVQADGIYTEGTATGRDYDENVDLKWDGVLVSQGRLTTDGFVIGRRHNWRHPPNTPRRLVESALGDSPT
jgi:hypothetical protein